MQAPAHDKARRMVLQDNRCIKLQVKLAGRSRADVRKQPDCAAAQAATVHNYKHNQLVAGESAVSHRLEPATGSHF